MYLNLVLIDLLYLNMILLLINTTFHLPMLLSNCCPILFFAYDSLAKLHVVYMWLLAMRRAPSKETNIDEALDSPPAPTAAPRLSRSGR